tara:strand:+ start:23 stop:406 length:384 start_codon:yes stop_codon:yes gene_type:complete
MSGNLLAKARRDVKKFIKSGGFQEEIFLITPDGLTTLTTSGLAGKHWINFDSDGVPINSKNAHICIDEDVLTLNNYPFRNSDGDVSLKGHKVNVKDSSGTLKNYIIKEWFPDETLGLIVCILGDYDY